MRHSRPPEHKLFIQALEGDYHPVVLILSRGGHRLKTPRQSYMRPFYAPHHAWTNPDPHDKPAGYLSHVSEAHADPQIPKSGDVCSPANGVDSFEAARKHARQSDVGTPTSPGSFPSLITRPRRNRDMALPRLRTERI